MKFEVENLIEDYNRRIKNAEDLLVELRKGKSSEVETRLVAKISAWTTFIAELNQILQND
jgi:hypothetical protein